MDLTPDLSFWWSWWRHQMETFSALLALCAGNSPVPVNSPHKGQWRGALMFTLICARINDWVNNREAGDLRRLLDHYDVSVMNISLKDICFHLGFLWMKKNNPFQFMIIYFQGNSFNARRALGMYEDMLNKLHTPVYFSKEAVFVPSYHEKYPCLIIWTSCQCARIALNIADITNVEFITYVSWIILICVLCWRFMIRFYCRHYRCGVYHIHIMNNIDVYFILAIYDPCFWVVLFSTMSKLQRRFYVRVRRNHAAGILLCVYLHIPSEGAAFPERIKQSTDSCGPFY